MSGKIELRYHPALKEMWFRRWENGGWVNVDLTRSILHKYAPSNNGNGQILQNLGTAFFDDIGKSADGIKEITIHFKGTKLDYGDFESMVEHYNRQNKDISFSIGDFTELKDMESLYQDVKSFSEEAIAVLDNVSKKNSVLENRKGELQEQIKDLKEKKGKLDDNTVNLCFVGTYSSGKSTLINAVLGYEVLPEAVNSETAKMFKIRSVKEQTDARVSFKIRTVESESERLWCAELGWDDTAKAFGFRTEIQESKVRGSIQKCINDSFDDKGDRLPLHEQLRQILTAINKQPNGNTAGKFDDYVEGIIELYFPIPLCGSDIDFTLYDTPGTDSNYVEHLSILKKALEEQTNSILIFVNRPTKLEGTGNAMLIELLDNIEANASKSTIDIGRSLFVLNAADEIMKGEDGFNDLKKSVIKLQPKTQDGNSTEDKKNGKEILLNDKRLFFISARAAYVARATKNGIANRKDEKDKKKLEYSLVGDEDAGYFRYNSMALSEYNTEQMQKEAFEATREANGNTDELFVVNSGLFSLESEIKKYGYKFAMAVKAKSIIDAIQSVVGKFDAEVKALEQAKNMENKELETQIKKLKKDLVAQIEDACKEFNEKEGLHDSGNFSKELLAKLHLNDEAIKELLNKISKTVDRIWSVGFTGKWTELDNQEALNAIQNYVEEYYASYDFQSKRVMNEKLERLNGCIRSIIENCNIDDDTKKLLSAVPPVVLDPAVTISTRVNIECHMERRWYLLFLKALDTNAYKDDIARESFNLLNEAREEFEKDYKKRLSKKSYEIEANYRSNIDRYSRKLEQLRDDKASVEKDLVQLANLVTEIKEKRVVLDNKIWGEQNG